MITLNIDIKTDKAEFDPENIVETIDKVLFDEFDEFAIYVMAELHPDDEKVYILAYGSEDEGVVMVDHSTRNIVDNILTQCQRNYETSEMDNVFLFAETNYNDAYVLAIDMKEQTGMLKWQLEHEVEKGTPTIKNGGIKVTSNKN